MSIRIVSGSHSENSQRRRSGRQPHARRPLQCKKGSNPGSFLKNYLRFRRLWQDVALWNTAANQILRPSLNAIDSRP
jgi:hypothetical protein